MILIFVMGMLQASGPGSSGSPSSQHSTPQGDTQGGLAEPMQTDASPAERSMGLTNTHAAAAQPASSSAAASEAMSKAMSNGHGQSQAQMAPAAQQVRRRMCHCASSWLHKAFKS